MRATYLTVSSMLATSCVALLAIACVVPPMHEGPAVPRTRSFRMPPANSGEEAYSAWFGNSDGSVLYFGLSPFWELWWQCEGDAAADLSRPGDHLI